jgi:tetratricopeptide (TPR) repeat protein/CHAT domain-containing protein
MPNTEAVITLAIKAAAQDDQRIFLFHIQLNGEVIAPNQSLSPADAQAARDLSKQYNALYEKHRAPNLVSDDLRYLGGQLFNTWLASAWPTIITKLQPGATRALVIASDVPEILNLPWELIAADSSNFIGLDAKFTVRRLPKKDVLLAAANTQLPPRPLRILFMACAPREQTQLEFEREEDAIIKAIAKAGTNVAFDSGDAGTFEELLERINEFQPHVVHLTGHGVVKDDGLGYFAFEDERGDMDLRSSVDMREQLFSGSGVQLAFISGCQTGKAPPIAAMGGICQGLVSEEVPMAIGWAASIADDIATQFAARFYKTLAAGQSVDRALTQARQAIRKTCDDRGYPGWTLPVLYSATRQAMVFDTDLQRQPVPPPRPSVVQQPLEGISEGYTDHFVGRRRELQRLLPALKEGTLHTLIVTGLGGAGKSTLATRLARKLEAFGFTLIPVSSTKEVPLSAARLLTACGDAFLKADLRAAYDKLIDPSIPVDARLRFIVSTLNAQRFLLVLDNFEVNLDETKRRILDSTIADFYKHLLSSLVGQSRAIITCRYLPAEMKLPMTAREEPLGDFPESSFMKFMLRDVELEHRYYAGELPRELLSELHRLLGGTPRFLGQMREALKTMTADELRIELQTVKLTANATAGVLQRERDEYCETIFTARLYGYLSAESQAALSRAAVYSVAVNVEGLAAVTGVSIDGVRGFLREWQNYALAYPDTERGADDLWSVYGLLRGWLLSRLSDEERRTTHRTAGDFLYDMVKQNRASELGMNWVECLIEARAQYLDAGEFALAREATDHISLSLLRQGLYKDLESINREMLTYEAHSGPMNWIGRAYSACSDYPEAREWFQKSLTAAGDDISEEALIALDGLASIDLNVGDYDAARDKLNKLLEMGQQIGDGEGEALAWHELAVIDMKAGDYDAARDKLNTALTMRQQTGDRAGEAATWHNLATIDSKVGDYDAARDKFQKALAIARQVGDRGSEAMILHNLASIDLRVGDYDAARDKSQNSLAFKQQIGDRVGEAATFYQLGIVADKTGRLVESARLVALSYLIIQSIGHVDVKYALQGLSQIAARLNYTQEQVEAMLREVSEAYEADRGAGLIQAAFGKV